MWKSGTIAYELFLPTKTNKNRTELTNKPTNKLGRIVEVFIYSKKSKILISSFVFYAPLPLLMIRELVASAI